jgi:hypothetical protein
MFEVLAASIVRALMMEAAGTSEILVNYHQTTQHNISEDSHLLQFITFMGLSTERSI